VNATQEAPVLQTPDPLLGRLLDAAIEAIGTNAERLGELDRAIGDGDHGLNMLRGFAAIAAQRDGLAALPLGAALEAMGKLLVMTVGGASGPLYGSLLIAMGKAAARDDASVLAMLDEGVAAVKRRGKSDRGEKTMLDVLVPVQLAWAQSCREGLAARAALERLRRAAKEGLEATRPLVATKGRASFLGERSIGHLDPGACSSFLLVDAACAAFLEDAP
jgi:phosphoenolpyruvate---glycerone phosphotransferase subunit DhaL